MLDVKNRLPVIQTRWEELRQEEAFLGAQKPAPYPSRRSKGFPRERIPFVREGARAIPVQPIYENAAGDEEGEE